MIEKDQVIEAVHRAVARLAFDVSTLFRDGAFEIDDFEAHIRPLVEALVKPLAVLKTNPEDVS